jgi:uncharacterized protein (TIGR02266 family)
MSVSHQEQPSRRSSSSRSESRVSLVDLRYRSAGSFLIAYASSLSRGEVFLETDTPFRLGTKVVLRIQAPGAAALKIEGSVAWTRAIAIGPGQPAGMGIALASSIEAHGGAIDDLVARYVRVRIVVAGAAPGPRAIVGRYLRSILTCDVFEVDILTGVAAFEREIQAGIDLAMIDLDSERAAGEAVIQSMKVRGTTAEIPIVALALMERDRARAAALGVDEVLTTPPLFTELQTTVLHTLARPVSWTRPPPPSTVRR